MHAGRAPASQLPPVADCLILGTTGPEPLTPNVGMLSLNAAVAVSMARSTSWQQLAELLQRLGRVRKDLSHTGQLV